MEASLLCASERARLTGTPPTARSGEESVAICRVAVIYHGGHPAAPCPEPGGSPRCLSLRLDGLLLSEEGEARVFVPRGDLCDARLHARRSWDWRGARWHHHGLDLAIDFSYWADSPPATLWLRAGEGQGAACAAVHRGIVALMALATGQLSVAPPPARPQRKQIRAGASSSVPGRQALAPVLAMVIVLALLPALLAPTAVRASVATPVAAITANALDASSIIPRQTPLGGDRWETPLLPGWLPVP